MSLYDSDPRVFTLLNSCHDLLQTIADKVASKEIEIIKILDSRIAALEARSKKPHINIKAHSANQDLTTFLPEEIYFVDKAGTILFSSRDLPKEVTSTFAYETYIKSDNLASQIDNLASRTDILYTEYKTPELFSTYILESNKNVFEHG